jgi:hypothetical protein
MPALPHISRGLSGEISLPGLQLARPVAWACMCLNEMTALQYSITRKSSVRISNCCVTFSMSFNLSVPQFSPLLNGANLYLI